MGNGPLTDRSDEQIVKIFSKLSRKDLEHLAFYPWAHSQRHEVAYRIIIDSAEKALDTRKKRKPSNTFGGLGFDKLLKLEEKQGVNLGSGAGRWRNRKKKRTKNRK